jgi:methyltransferase (TIGR00027 family)
VLDDPFALLLVGPAWREMRHGPIAVFPDEVLRQVLAGLCTRGRYAEDRLAAGAFTQYVILGAGLDSFAWRRPDLLGSLRVFEVDHPASQAGKLARVDGLALPLGDSQVFVPVDFETGSLQDALRAAGFDWDQLAASLGEPIQPGWPVTEIERLVSRCGLKVVDHPARADLEERYFAGRADGLRPFDVETLLTARVT